LREQAIQAAMTTSRNAPFARKAPAIRHVGKTWRSTITLPMCWMISPRLAAGHEHADGSRDLAKRHRLAQHFIKLFSRTTQLLWGISDPREKFEHFRSP